MRQTQILNSDDAPARLYRAARLPSAVRAPDARPEWLVKAEAEADQRFTAIQWQHGKWYGLYDEDDGPATQLFYRCFIDDGCVYLVEDLCDHDKRAGIEAEVHDARSLFTRGTRVVAL